MRRASFRVTRWKAPSADVTQWLLSSRELAGKLILPRCPRTNFRKNNDGKMSARTTARRFNSEWRISERFRLGAENAIRVIRLLRCANGRSGGVAGGPGERSRRDKAHRRKRHCSRVLLYMHDVIFCFNSTRIHLFFFFICFAITVFREISDGGTDAIARDRESRGEG